MMEQKKKPTNEQLRRRIERAIVMVEKTKATKEIFFSDRGLRLVVNDDYAVIATGFHRHVFDKWTMGGVSKPYEFTAMVIDLAEKNDCTATDNKGEKYYSFAKLMETLKNDEKKNLEYLIVHYYSMWLMNIFDSLYTIGDSESSAFMTFLQYCCCIARQALILAEHTQDYTNKQFVGDYIEKIKEFTSNLTEQVLFKKKTDDEYAKEQMEAMQEQQNEDIINKQIEDESKENM